MNTAALERNVRLYPWFMLLMRAYFWQAIFILYFRSQLPLEQVFRLEALYYLCVVIIEVPSGYASDRIGRRPVLIISAAAAMAAYLCFSIGGSFGMLAAAQVMFATSVSFKSGTVVSLHYDSLSELGRESEYGAREARAERFGFTGEAGSALIGGLAASVDLQYPYLLSLIAAGMAFFVALRFVEPQSASRSLASFVGQVGVCIGSLRQRPLRWLFGFSVMMTVLNHVPYEFWQPYVDELRSERGLSADATPLMTGLFAAATLWFAGMVAGHSARLRDRFGTGPVLLSATILQTLIIVSMTLVVHPGVIALILMRSMPRGIMTAPLNAAIAPLIATQHRATYLSLQSLVGRLSFSGALFGLTFVGGAGEDWSAVEPVMRWWCVIAGAGLLVLLVTVGALPREEESA